MRLRTIGALLVGAVSLPPALAQDPSRTERVLFPRGTASKTIRSSLKGYRVVNYLIGASAGQTLSVTMKTSNPSSYFNVTAPGAQAALFMGEMSGNRYSGRLPSNGEYKVQVYLMRNAARRDETANYTLTISVHG